MNKIILFLFAYSIVFSANSAFTHVRVASYDSNGDPEEEIIDLSICLERTPTVAQELLYEDVIGYFADGLYEVSNGGNYLGNVTIYTGERFCSSTTIVWNKKNEWPHNSHSFVEDGSRMVVSDDWSEGIDHLGNEVSRFDFGITLAHESVHHFYGLDDDYAKTAIQFVVTADPDSDRIIIWDLVRDADGSLKPTNKITYPTHYIDMISPFKDKGTPVVFIPMGDTSIIPQGLSGGPIRGTGTMVSDYATIDQIWDSTSIGKFSFNLKDPNGNHIDIKNGGSGTWTLDLPSWNWVRNSYARALDLPVANRSSVAHSIMGNNHDVATSWYCSPDGIRDIQWQWANLSTEFNIDPYSAQGMCCRDENGRPTSAWDKVTTDPEKDLVYGGSYPNRRYWFKSLAKRKPTASDVFRAKSFLTNYNPATGKIQDGYAVWLYDETCGHEKTYDLPFMKVELAGQHPSAYRRRTHKYLNIRWDRPETEKIVLVDISSSMGVENKLEKAKLSAKNYIKSSLNEDPAYTTFNNSNVSVGVYAFNDSVVKVRSLITVQSLLGLDSAIDSLTAGGNTAFFDALYSAIDNFSDTANQKILYVISDGIDYRSTHTEKEVVDLYRSKNISINTFAYGTKACRGLLSSMAAETGGEYFEEGSGLAHEVIASTANVLAAMPGNTQLKAAVVAPAQTSGDVYLPRRLQRARVYASYDIPSSSSTGSSSGSAGSPIELLTQGGASIPFFPTSNTIGNTVYFTAEVDSATLVSLPNSAFKVKNNLSGANVDFRVIATGEYQEHSMNATLFPEGLFEWPVQKYFTASVRGLKGILADVDAVGKLVTPDGNVVNFTLRDDGLGGDFRAGDGLYYADMPPISKNGTYRWEITMSSPGGVAHTTRVGTTLPDSIPFTEVVDPNPFEFVRNGQFIVTGCCTDESNTNLVKLKPEKRVNAFLQTGSDTDRFEIEATLAGRSYSLRLSSKDLSSFDRVEVYQPSDSSIPVYSVNVANNGSGYISIPLSAEFAKPGNIVAVVGTNSSGVNYDLFLLEKETAEFSVGRFEVATDWHSQHTTLALDGNRKSEGNTSLVTPAGWKIIESRNISTSDFDVIGERMSIDVFVPASTQNPYWIGTLELWLYVPSSNKRIQLGEQIQLDPYFGNWKSYEFRVPSRVKKVLSEQHHDARFQVVLNTADSLWIDNLRFVGKLTDNPVNQVEPECPQDNGCGSSTPIMLHVNESKRVVPEGDLWIEITGFPNDWTPAVVTLGIAPEDGIEMTGSMTYDNGTYPLSGWYMEKSFGFVRGKRYLVKLHNLGHRPYRVNAWVSGQAMGVASLGLPYNVELGVNW